MTVVVLISSVTVFVLKMVLVIVFSISSQVDVIYLVVAGIVENTV